MRRPLPLPDDLLLMLVLDQRELLRPAVKRQTSVVFMVVRQNSDVLKIESLPC